PHEEGARAAQQRELRVFPGRSLKQLVNARKLLCVSTTWLPSVPQLYVDQEKLLIVSFMSMIFEMTRDYDIVMPMIIAVAISIGVRRVLSHENIYTIKLVGRRHFIPKPYTPTCSLFIGLAM